jgi:hypothetical protein
MASAWRERRRLAQGRQIGGVDGHEADAVRLEVLQMLNRQIQQ